MCGQCINVCPVGALTEKDDTQKVWDALADDNKHVVVQFSPAVRIAISEEFGLPMGAISTGKLVAALRRMGFNKVFDTNWSADLTIMEEGNELLHRLQNGGTLPMITSCSPGWVKFCENHFPYIYIYPPPEKKKNDAPLFIVYGQTRPSPDAFLK